jgi:hypothetical protein
MRCERFPQRINGSMSGVRDQALPTTRSRRRNRVCGGNSRPSRRDGCMRYPIPVDGQQKAAEGGGTFIGQLAPLAGRGNE